jgi:hypothetical protein
MPDATLSKHELNQFYGTENWYKHWCTKLLYTDGIKYVAGKVGAYWFIDHIALQVLPLVDHRDLIDITLAVEKSKGRITVKNRQTLVHEFNLDYTTFPEGTWEFCLCDNVLCLPLER